MINKFEDGKTYIFDIPTYLKNNENQRDMIENNWVHKCNQKTVNIIGEKQGCIVINGTLFSIIPKWCKEKIYVARNLDFNSLSEGEF